MHFLSHLYNDDWDWKQLNEFKKRLFYLPFVFVQDRLILKQLNQIKLNLRNTPLHVEKLVDITKLEQPGSSCMWLNDLICETLCTIWYHLHNLKNVKNTQASVCNFTKSNTLPWVFFTFFYYTNGTKSRKASYLTRHKSKNNKANHIVGNLLCRNVNVYHLFELSCLLSCFFTFVPRPQKCVSSMLVI